MIDAYADAIRSAVSDVFGVPEPANTVADAPIWTPNPGAQTLACESLADELFYGGAGGGGKTDLLLGLSMTRHHSSAIFRSEFAQFRGPEGMIERSKEIAAGRGRLNEHTFQWRGLPGGRSFEFAGVGSDKDLGKWKGRPHDLKGFDEIPEFTEYRYRFLIGWLRTSIEGQRTRVVATGNPPTNTSGNWVIAYWGPWLDPRHANPAKPGELRWYATIDGKDTERPNGDPFEMPPSEERDRQVARGLSTLVRPRSRTFIPARVEDNPYYMRTGYIDVLNNLPEPLRSQLRYGDFQKTQDDDPWQVIPTSWVQAAQARWSARKGPDMPLTSVGCDPSRGGKDKFCLAPRYGNYIGEIKKHDPKEAPDGQRGAKLIYASLLRWAGKALDPKSVPVNIDVIGSAGSSVFDQARDLELAAVGLNGSERSEAFDQSGRLRFKNKRAEWQWRMREWLDPASGQEIALPLDPELLADLCAPRWRITPRGIQIEEKDHIKERIGRSPDAGESVIYAFAEDSGSAAGLLGFAREAVAAAEAKEAADAPTAEKDDNPWLEALTEDPDA